MYFRRIRELRVDHEYPQKRLAIDLDITRPQYSIYERGVREIPVHLLVKLAKIYNVSVDYIIGLTDTMKKYPEPKIQYYHIVKKYYEESD